MAHTWSYFQSFSWETIRYWPFSGSSKPADVHAYLHDFIAEMNELQQSPLTIPELACEFEVNISSIICDTPARAFVKQVKGHSG